MKYSKLGNTDLKVSKICLGTMTWGEQNTEKEAHEQLNYAIEKGVNFIDTAEMYAVPPRKETYGLTEKYIGTWLKTSQKRVDLIIATKVIGKADRFSYIRGGNACLNKDNIIAACENSLKRLQTDYIDLYQLHWPDRQTNFFGQLGYQHQGDDDFDLLETLEALDELVKNGKVRHIGISNETPWGMMKMIQLAEKYDLPRAVSIQNPYNLLNRTFEIGLAEIAIRENCGLLAYSPLAFGSLSGKYLNNARPEKARLTKFPAMQRYQSKLAKDMIEKYCRVAKLFDYSPAQMALAYVNTRDFLTSNIIGATNLEQLEENIESVDLDLPMHVIEEIEKLHLKQPNPCP